MEPRPTPIAALLTLAACAQAPPDARAVDAVRPLDELQARVRLRAQAADAARSGRGLRRTGRDLDLAIDGEGFFELQLPDGTVGYTRDGRFQVDIAGRLVSAGGLPLLPAMSVPQDAVELRIARDGRVTAHTQDGRAALLGRIELVRFPQPAYLGLGRDDVLRATTASGRAAHAAPGEDSTAALLQGWLETPGGAGYEAGTLRK